MRISFINYIFFSPKIEQLALLPQLRFADLAGFGEWETLGPGERRGSSRISGQQKPSVTAEKPSTL